VSFSSADLPLRLFLVELRSHFTIYHPIAEIMGRVAEWSAGDFDTAIVQAGLPILVDFWSPTCRPCRTLVPILEELAEENEGEATIAKVNAAQYPELVAQYGIDTLPTLLLFNQGRVVERMVGVQSKHKLQAVLDEIE
jgi:thioredoxin 1